MLDCSNEQIRNSDKDMNAVLKLKDKTYLKAIHLEKAME
jgi:hypothetical protein